MKKKFLTAMVFATLFAASCDFSHLFPPKKEDMPIPEQVTADNVKPLSVTGERMEKYFWTVDPSLYTRNETRSGTSETVSYVEDLFPLYKEQRASGAERYMLSPDKVTTASSNELTVTAQLRDYAIRGGRPVTFSGRLAHLTTREYTVVTTISISGSKIVTGKGMARSSFNVTETRDISWPLDEEYDVPQEFSLPSIRLPRTEKYSSPYREYKYHTYRFNISAEDMNSFLDTNEAKYGRDISFSFDTYDPYILESRNFFQYVNVRAAYDKSFFLFGFEPEPIVSAYEFDAESNAITVELNPYNEPYIGKLISFWIKDEDGAIAQKTIAIGE